jgi:hypothetical protein
MGQSIAAKGRELKLVGVVTLINSDQPPPQLPSATCVVIQGDWDSGFTEYTEETRRAQRENRV